MKYEQIPVLFENDSCIVFNKPAGLPVQGGEGVKVSLDSILLEKISPRPLLVHRLDRDSSGIILVAKTKEAAAAFSAFFSGSKGGTGALKKERAVLKQYLGVCSGVPRPEQGIIRLALDEKGKGQAKKTKESETSYRVVSRDSALQFSLLELELGTGRMHQIRRHLAAIGHPLLGDDKYGDFPLNRKLKKTAGLKHLLLHSSRLVIPPCPQLPQGLDITAPLPDTWHETVPDAIFLHLSGISSII